MAVWFPGAVKLRLAEYGVLAAGLSQVAVKLNVRGHVTEAPAGNGARVLVMMVVPRAGGLVCSRLVMALLAVWPAATVTLAGVNTAASQACAAGAAGWVSLRLQTAPSGTLAMAAVWLPAALKLAVAV